MHPSWSITASVPYDSSPRPGLPDRARTDIPASDISAFLVNTVTAAAVDRPSAFRPRQTESSSAEGCEQLDSSCPGAARCVGLRPRWARIPLLARRRAQRASPRGSEAYRLRHRPHRQRGRRADGTPGSVTCVRVPAPRAGSSSKRFLSSCAGPVSCRSRGPRSSMRSHSRILNRQVDRRHPLDGCLPTRSTFPAAASRAPVAGLRPGSW